MLPPDVFKLESADDGVPTEKQASYDLQFAGFLVFQVDHRLAPPGRLGHQLDTDKGYAPEQTDDLKRQILAALADPQCNGSIYLVGGSAGGTLVLWCALDPAPTVSGWDETARSHQSGGQPFRAHPIMRLVQSGWPPAQPAHNGRR